MGDLNNENQDLKNSNILVLCILSLVTLLVFLQLLFIINNSKDILYVSNMISYQKTLLIFAIFSILITLLFFVIKTTIEIQLYGETIKTLLRLIKYLFFNSIVGYILIILYYNLDVVLGYTVVKDRIEMNILGVVIFSMIIPLARFLSLNYNSKVQAIISIQLMIVLIIVARRIFQGAIIVEFSAVAYLFVPTVFLLRIKKLYITAAYAGFMAGLFYYLYIILNGGNTYHTLIDSKVYLSMFSHGTLLLVSLIYMKRIKFATKELLLVIGYLLFSLVWAIVNRPETNEFKFFIYDIIDGELLNVFFVNLSNVHYLIYYILLALFLLFSMRIFLRINSYFTKNTL